MYGARGALHTRGGVHRPAVPAAAGDMPSVAQVISKEREAIVEAWFRRVSTTAAARALPREAVIDTLPEWLATLERDDARDGARDGESAAAERAGIVEKHI